MSPNLTLGDHDLNKLKPALSESFHANLSYDSSVLISRKKNFNGLTKVLHYFDYLSFEEDLALKLHSLKFPVLKDDLYKV